MTVHQPFLSTENLTHAYEAGKVVFRDISLSIAQGSFTTLVGLSGIGKSTLLRILAGLLSPTHGRVILNGTPIHEAHTPIGIVFQRDNLMPWRTVYENVKLPLELQGQQDVRERVYELLKLVGLSQVADSYPGQLSGGMAQRVAIARALVHQPQLLFLDEPFGALDALTRERMGQELLRIRQAMPVTVFMVTHSIPEATLLADEVLVMGYEHQNRDTAVLTHRIPISLPRPRHFDMQETAVFHQCAKAIRAAIQNDAG